ncbi:unnamed protein product, partial [Pleuronectes platessa]
NHFTLIPSERELTARQAQPPALTPNSTQTQFRGRRDHNAPASIDHTDSCTEPCGLNITCELPPVRLRSFSSSPPAAFSRALTRHRSAGDTDSSSVGTKTRVGVLETPPTKTTGNSSYKDCKLLLQRLETPPKKTGNSSYKDWKLLLQRLETPPTKTGNSSYNDWKTHKS